MPEGVVVEYLGELAAGGDGGGEAAEGAEAQDVQLALVRQAQQPPWRLVHRNDAERRREGQEHSDKRDQRDSPDNKNPLFVCRNS